MRRPTFVTFPCVSLLSTLSRQATSITRTGGGKVLSGLAPLDRNDLLDYSIRKEALRPVSLVHFDTAVYRRQMLLLGNVALSLTVSVVWLQMASPSDEPRDFRGVRYTSTFDGSYRYGEEADSVLRVVLLLLTLVLEAQVLEYYRFQRRFELRAWMVMDSMPWARFKTAFLFVELLLCALHPLPGLSMQVARSLAMAMWLRLYLVFRAARNRSKIYRYRYRIKMNEMRKVGGIASSWFVSFKSYYNRHLLTTIVALTLGSLFVWAYLFFVTERDVLVNSWLWTTAVWCSTVTMSTVGYGLTVPFTDTGRVFTGLSSLIGIVLASIVVLAIINNVDLSPLQMQAYTVHYRAILYGRSRHAAAAVIQTEWRARAALASAPPRREWTEQRELDYDALLSRRLIALARFRRLRRNIVSKILANSMLEDETETRKPGETKQVLQFHTEPLHIAVVMPFALKQTNYAVASVWTWQTERFFPCRDNETLSAYIDMVFYVPRKTEGWEDMVRSLAEQLAPVRHCFNRVLFRSADVPKHLDTYGPGTLAQFYGIFDREYLNLPAYDYIMYMEPDARPVQAFWLDRLYWECINNHPFYSKGSAPLYGNVGDLHINGNAIYRYSDPGFLKYVCDSRGAFTDYASFDQSLAALRHRFRLFSVFDKFIYTPFIQNRAKAQLPPDIDTFVAENPNTYIVHAKEFIVIIDRELKNPFADSQTSSGVHTTEFVDDVVTVDGANACNPDNPYMFAQDLPPQRSTIVWPKYSEDL